MTLAEVEQQARNCTRCPLAGSRTNVVFARGDPKARLMLVGEGPGADEDAQGLPFVGRSGRLLDRLIGEEVGLDRSQVYVANTVKCRPPANRDPRPEETSSCRPYLDAQFDLVDPAVVVSLGNVATRLLLGTDRRISELRSRTYPFGRALLVPTFHPAAALRGGGTILAQMRADLVRAKALLADAVLAGAGSPSLDPGAPPPQWISASAVGG
ncbi:MAG: uracil-DNA glycosylase [Acidimicrobiales bacterium]